MFLFVSFAYKSLHGGGRADLALVAHNTIANDVYGEYSLKRVARACGTTASAVPKTKGRDYKTFRTRCDVMPWSKHDTAQPADNGPNGTARTRNVERRKVAAK